MLPVSELKTKSGSSSETCFTGRVPSEIDLDGRFRAPSETCLDGRVVPVISVYNHTKLNTKLNNED